MAIPLVYQYLLTLAVFQHMLTLLSVINVLCIFGSSLCQLLLCIHYGWALLTCDEMLFANS